MYCHFDKANAQNLAKARTRYLSGVVGSVGSGPLVVLPALHLERSSKEDGRQIVDVSLKELSFSQQLERDDGIETGDLAALRAAGRFPVIYDVRESEEYEVGRLPGIAHAFAGVVSPARFELKAAPGDRLAQVLEIGNERWNFERAFPRAEVAWLPTSAGDDQVLLMTRDALVKLARHTES